MITVEVNQQKHQVSESITLQALVSNLNIKTNGIAIAINNQVIKKTDWDAKDLQNNDAILIIQSTQGG